MVYYSKISVLVYGYLFQQQKSEWDLDPPTSIVNSEFWKKIYLAKPLSDITDN